MTNEESVEHTHFPTYQLKENSVLPTPLHNCLKVKHTPPIVALGSTVLVLGSSNTYDPPNYSLDWFTMTEPE
jgi:hypothetical protein